MKRAARAKPAKEDVLAAAIAKELFRYGSSYQCERLVLSMPSDKDRDLLRAGWVEKCVADVIAKHLKSRKAKP